MTPDQEYAHHREQAETGADSDRDIDISTAQVHATLAVAAAIRALDATLMAAHGVGSSQ